MLNLTNPGFSYKKKLYTVLNKKVTTEVVKESGIHSDTEITIVQNVE